MSWQSQILNSVLRLGQLRFKDTDVRFATAAMRLTMNRLAELRPRGLFTRSEVIDGVRCEWVWQRSSARAEQVTIYLHGGGFVAGSPASHYGLAKRLSGASQSRVLMVDYRLAPDFVFPAQLDDVTTVYRALLAGSIPAHHIAIAGDSAGANLALTSVLHWRALKLPLPVAVVAYSPWADLTHSGASITANADRDFTVPTILLDPMAALYCGTHDPRDPLVSPLFADFRAFPPLQLQVSAAEVLLDDTLRLAERARAAGVDVEQRVWPDMPHAFPVFAQWLPEGRAAIRDSGKFLRHNFSAAAVGSDDQQ
jgi:acetyl esterase/lipase